MKKLVVQKIIEDFSARVPAFVTRKEAERLTGGLLKARSLANADCAGVGVHPSGVVRIGKKVAYTKKAFLLFFHKKLEEGAEGSCRHN